MKKNYNVLYSLPFATKNGLLNSYFCTLLNSVNARFLNSTSGEIKIIAQYSTLNHDINPLQLSDGSFKKIQDIQMTDHLRWYKIETFAEIIGPIGYIHFDINTLKPWKIPPIDYDSEYDKYVINKLGLDRFANVHRLIENKEYDQVSINQLKLEQILKSLNPLCSYSFCYIIKLHFNKGFKTIGKHYLVNNTTNAKQLMLEFYITLLDYILKYEFNAIDMIMTRYWSLGIKVKDANYSTDNIKKEVIKETFTKKYDMRLKYMNSNFIPLTMRISVFYGVLIHKEGNILIFEYHEYIIKVNVIKYMEKHILSIFSKKTNTFIIGALDSAWNNGFIRTILKYDALEDKIENLKIDKNVMLYIENFKILNVEYTIKNSLLSLKDKEYIHNKKIITLDIECYMDDDNNLIPYACAFYDGLKYKCYYLTDYDNNWHEMIEHMIDDIMTNRKYAGYTVYAHNFNKFDSAFLFKNINKKYKITAVLPRDSGLLCFSVWNTVGGKKFKVKFTDSIALLPFSLAKLGQSFKVDTLKGIFPYSFVNKYNLNYIGEMPEYKYYEQSADMMIKYSDMKTWYNNDWNMKKETLAYLHDDVVSLYEILLKMDNTIFNNYRINITSNPTIASLALTILRSNFLNENSKLPKTTGSLEAAVRSAYFGGRTELFIPMKHNIYSYDFNSLYPTAMLKDLPVGNAVYSLEKDLTKIFGFIKVKFTTPPGMNIPILPVRISTKGNDTKLIFPCGTCTGWYFSEEVKLAQEYGYDIEIIESYIFERGVNTLTNYVLHMSAIKDSTEGAMRDIHKLLLNTPYGRMGMRNIRDGIIIANLQQYVEIIKKHEVLDAFPLTDELFFVKYNKSPSKNACLQSGIDYETELLKYNEKNDFVENSTPIAAAIASWARIIMYPWIINSAYTDTDSIFVDHKLPQHMVGKSLGKFKQEYGGIIYKAMFVAPKFYYLSTHKGDIFKTKGISTNISKIDFLKLTNGESLIVRDNRWLRNLSSESVQILTQDIIISSDFDKRNKLFSLGKWVGTSPLVINNNREIVCLDLVLYNVMYKLDIIIFNSDILQKFYYSLIEYCIQTPVCSAATHNLIIENINIENNSQKDNDLDKESVALAITPTNICLLPREFWGEFKWENYEELDVQIPIPEGRWLWLDFSVNYVHKLYSSIFENDKLISKLYEGKRSIPAISDDAKLFAWKFKIIGEFINIENKILEYGPSCLSEQELTNAFIYWYSSNYVHNYLIELGYDNKWIIRSKTDYELEVEKFYIEHNYDLDILKNYYYYDYYLLKNSNLKINDGFKYNTYELISNIQ